jgi:hypothetical protein
MSTQKDVIKTKIDKKTAWCHPSTSTSLLGLLIYHRTTQGNSFRHNPGVPQNICYDLLKSSVSIL